MSSIVILTSSEKKTAVYGNAFKDFSARMTDAQIAVHMLGGPVRQTDARQRSTRWVLA